MTSPSATTSSPKFPSYESRKEACSRLEVPDSDRPPRIRYVRCLTYIIPTLYIDQLKSLLAPRSHVSAGPSTGPSQPLSPSWRTTGSAQPCRPTSLTTSPCPRTVPLAAASGIPSRRTPSWNRRSPLLPSPSRISSTGNRTGLKRMRATIAPTWCP